MKGCSDDGKTSNGVINTSNNDNDSCRILNFE